ncbi:MAG: carboxylesterase family protein [Prevotella sp.]|nr:carboxylesterase family protein [Prevotella sp.]
MRRIALMTVSLLVAMGIWAQSYKQENDISYTTKTDAYSKERLKLDVYYPEGANDVPVVVWFHGGGLEQGEKEIPWKLKEKGMVLKRMLGQKVNP